MRIPALLVSTVVSAVLALPVAAQQTAATPKAAANLTGRWVKNQAEYPIALYIKSDGTVRQFLPAPQFSATYQVDGDRIVSRASDGSSQMFTLKEGTLSTSGGVMTRPAGTTGKTPSDPRGTWVMM